LAQVPDSLGLHVSKALHGHDASRNFANLLFFRLAEGLGETFCYLALMLLMSDYHGRATRSRTHGHGTVADVSYHACATNHGAGKRLNLRQSWQPFRNPAEGS
jgi:hypothetical protein